MEPRPRGVERFASADDWQECALPSSVLTRQESPASEWSRSGLQISSAYFIRRNKCEVASSGPRGGQKPPNSQDCRAGRRALPQDPRVRLLTTSYFFPNTVLFFFFLFQVQLRSALWEWTPFFFLKIHGPSHLHPGHLSSIQHGGGGNKGRFGQQLNESIKTPAKNSRPMGFL